MSILVKNRNLSKIIVQYWVTSLRCNICNITRVSSSYSRVASQFKNTDFTSVFLNSLSRDSEPQDQGLDNKSQIFDLVLFHQPNTVRCAGAVILSRVPSFALRASNGTAMRTRAIGLRWAFFSQSPSETKVFYRTRTNKNS